MRSTSDLVHEMQDEARSAWLVAIAVGFENDTKFVFSTARFPLEELNALTREGGSPIGLLRFDNEVSGVQGSYRPFAEYADQPWVEGYLAGLLDNTGEIVAMGKSGRVTPPGPAY